MKKIIAGLACGILVGTLGIGTATAQGDEGRRLSLSECLNMALENNLSLVSARFGPELAEVDIGTNQAEFDSNLVSLLNHSESEAAASQASSLSSSDTDFFRSTYTQDTQLGLDYSAELTLQDTTFSAGNSVFDAQAVARLGVDVTYALLKGRGREANTINLVLARNNLEVSRRDLEGQAELTVEAVEGAYWDVLAAREALRIERISLNRADDLLDLNRKKVEVGTLAPIEITQAEAGVASQEEGVIVAETALQDAEDELRRLMAIPHGDPLWNTPIVPSDVPAYEVKEVDLDGAIATALSSRHEVANARQTVQDNELSERVARRDVRHQLDVNAGYTATGTTLGGPGIPDPDNPGEFLLKPSKADVGDSLSNVFDNDEFDWNVSLTYTIPFRNRAAKAGYSRARIMREQSEVDREDQEQTVRVEVRRSVRAVESNSKRVQAARKNVELQTEKLEAEQKKFENGMSTSFEVLTFQNDLADAELAEVRARLDYIKSLAALERSKGTLMEARNLNIQ